MGKASLLFLLWLTASPASACLMSAEEKETLFNRFDSNTSGGISLEEYIHSERTRVESSGSWQGDSFYSERFYAMASNRQKEVKLKEFSPISLQKCS